MVFIRAGVSCGYRDGESVRKTSTSSGTSSRKLEGTSPLCPLISPCGVHKDSETVEMLCDNFYPFLRDKLKFQFKVALDLKNSFVQNSVSLLLAEPRPFGVSMTMILSLRVNESVLKLIRDFQ